MSSTDARRFASQTLLKHLVALAAQIRGVREAKDIEAVHQMRVASRRMRSALGLLDGCVTKKKLRTWLRQIKRVTKSLGAARDVDVQIEAVSKYLDGLRAAGGSAHRAGVERLRLRLRQRRERLQRDVIATMDELESSGVIDDMRRTLLHLKVESHMRDIESAESFGGGDGAAPAAEAPALSARDARRQIALRLEQMLAYEPYIATPENIEELHAMRIASKGLRYTMENFAPLFGKQLKWPIRQVKQVQSMLGDIHDLDVWMEFLPEFIDAERQRHEAFFGHRRGFKRIETGVLHMLADLRDRRQTTYEQFLALWAKQSREGRWRDLRELVGRCDDDAEAHDALAVDADDVEQDEAVDETDDAPHRPTMIINITDASELQAAG